MESKAIQITELRSDDADSVIQTSQTRYWIPPTVKKLFSENQETPPCFLVIGKPGCGRSALAKKLAEEYEAVYLNPKDLIAEYLENGSEIGTKCKKLLERGESISTLIIMTILTEKIRSPKVLFSGYVLDDFPSTANNFTDLKNQLDFVHLWPLLPDYIIDIKIENKDLYEIRTKQMLDPETHIVHRYETFTQIKKFNISDYVEIKKKQSKETDVDEVEEEEEEEEEMRLNESEMENETEVQDMKNLRDKFVFREQDTESNVLMEIKCYEKNFMHVFDEYMYLKKVFEKGQIIQLNGNLEADHLFQQLIARLIHVRPVPKPIALFKTKPKLPKSEVKETESQVSDQEDEVEEEETRSEESEEGTDESLEQFEEEEDLFKFLETRKILGSKYKWKRSKFQKYCPVAIYEGNCTEGEPINAVVYRGEIYLLASYENREKFLANPLKYSERLVVPPRFAVGGTDKSGRTITSRVLASQFDGELIDYDDVLQPKIDELKRIHLEEELKRAKIRVINEIKERVSTAIAKNKTDLKSAARDQLIQKKKQILKLKRLIEKEKIEEDSKKLNEDVPANQTGDEEEETKVEDSDNLEYSEQQEISSEIQEDSEEQENVEGTLEQAKDEEEKEEEEEEKVEENDSVKTGDVSDVTDEEILNLTREMKELEVNKLMNEQAVIENDPCMDENMPLQKAFELYGNTEKYVYISDMKLLEVTDDHPEIIEVFEAIRRVEETYDPPLSPEVIFELIVKKIESIEKSKTKGFVFDNFNIPSDVWQMLDEKYPSKRKLIDQYIFLKDEDTNHSIIKQRYYDENKEWIDKEEKERLAQLRVEKVNELLAEKRDLISNQITDLQTRRDEMINNLDKLREEKEKFEVKSVKSDEKSGDTSSANEQVAPNEQVVSLPEESTEEKEQESDNSKEPEEDPQPVQIEQNDETEERLNDIKSEINKTETMIEEIKEELALKEEELENVAESNIDFDETPFIYDTKDEVPSVAPINEFTEKVTKQMNTWHNTESMVSTTFAPIVLEVSSDMCNNIGDLIYKPFKFKVEDLSGDQEGDEMEEEDESVAEEEEDEEVQLGPNTFNYCPVALKNHHIYIPVNDELAVKYKSKTYYFFSEENKELFTENPEDYIDLKDLKIPPKFLIIGTKASGKSLCAKELAKKYGLIHIQFREYLVEKMKQRMPNFTDNIYNAELNENAEPMISDDETEEEDSKKDSLNEKVELSENEESIKTYLLDGEMLSNECVIELLSNWWTKTPYTNRGIILEGCPINSEHVTGMVENNLIPDCVIQFNNSHIDAVKRLLPGRLQNWKNYQKVKQERRTQKREEQQMKRQELIDKRRAELEEEEMDPEEIEETLQNELPDDEDDEETDEVDETEIDAKERMKGEIITLLESQEEELTVIQEGFQENRIHYQLINTNTNKQIMVKRLEKQLQFYLDNRISMQEKSTIITHTVAQDLLDIGYCTLSKFQDQSPIDTTVLPIPNVKELNFPYLEPAIKKIQLSSVQEIDENDSENEENSEENIKLETVGENPKFPSTNTFPLLYKSKIYYFNSAENRSLFQKNPLKYTDQSAPFPSVPMRIAIIGPPKSGRTTLALRFCELYGLVRISLGGIIRQLINEPVTFETTEPMSDFQIARKMYEREMKRQKLFSIGQSMLEYLDKGESVPDDLIIFGLQYVMLNSQCNTRGCVFDGFPTNFQQLKCMRDANIIPNVVLSLNVNSNECIKRCIIDRSRENRFYVAHDSPEIIALKYSLWEKEMNAVISYFNDDIRILERIDASKSIWHVWHTSHHIVLKRMESLRKFIFNVLKNQPAMVSDLGIHKDAILSRLCSFGSYCPVSYTKDNELIDCNRLVPHFQHVVEFGNEYYRFRNEMYANKFMEDPMKYLGKMADRPLPENHLLPKIINYANNPVFGGFCSVTYVDGFCKYDALVLGNNNFAAEYNNGFHCFASEIQREKFMKTPWKYINLLVPKKLPPTKVELCLKDLPTLGYLEQTVANAIGKALFRVGRLKPKHPFMSTTQSALYYLAYQLQAGNENTSEWKRKKYRNKIKMFENNCSLTHWLAENVRIIFEPEAKELNRKIEEFIELKHLQLTPNWLI
ncbi:hypothetical protein SNEBB_008710 [Seison nebaliae]|nr:hypothetical protein SNEBB_008710 [Seison nebaliae]